MDWINQDWEREAELDVVYAVERQLLIEQEYFEYESKQKRKPAKITYKKHGNKSNTPSLSRVAEKGAHLRRNLPAKVSRRWDRR